MCWLAERLAGDSQMEMPEGATSQKKKGKHWWLEFIRNERALAKKRKAKKAAKARGEVLPRHARHACYFSTVIRSCAAL